MIIPAISGLQLTAGGYCILGIRPRLKITLVGSDYVFVGKKAIQISLRRGVKEKALIDALLHTALKRILDL